MLAVNPRRALLRAIRDLDPTEHANEAYALECNYRRSLSDEREPLNVSAVGACLAILGKIEHPAAREGVSALAELLVADAPARAA